MNLPDVELTTRGDGVGTPSRGRNRETVGAFRTPHTRTLSEPAQGTVAIEAPKASGIKWKFHSSLLDNVVMTRLHDKINRSFDMMERGLLALSAAALRATNEFDAFGEALKTLKTTKIERIRDRRARQLAHYCRQVIR